MPLSSFRLTLLLTPLVWLLALTPVAAQDMRAKDAWDLLRSMADGAGFVLRAEGLHQDGATLVARSVTLQGAEAPHGLSLNLLALRMEPRGADGVALIIVPGAFVQADGPGGESRIFDLFTQGEMMLSVQDDEIAFAPDLSHMRLTLREATRRGVALDEAFDLVIDRLTGAVRVTTGPEIALDARLAAGQTRYDLRIVDTHPMTIHRIEQVEVDATSLELMATQLQVLGHGDGQGSFRRAVEQGFGARMRLQSQGSRSSADQTIGLNRIVMQSEGGPSDGEISLEQGIFSVMGGGEAIDVSFSVNGIGGDVSIGLIGTRLGFPLLATASDEVFGLSLDVEALRIGEGLWGLLGANGFADETADLSLGVLARGRWLVDITDGDGTDDVPFDLSEMELSGLSLRFGGTNLEGQGRFDVAPGGMTDVEGIPEGTGNFTFDLNGGEALLARLGTEGVLPPDQQFLARMMMTALGRAVGEDHLRSEISIRPGGQILVNGLPLPF